MVPAVRNPNTPKMHCIDEPAGDCTYERYTLCAFDSVSFTFGASHTFLECMEYPWDEPLKHAKVRTCAKQASMDYDAISSCFSSSRGDALLQQASDEYVSMFPSPVYMPQASVNGHRVGHGDDTASYDAIKKAACAAGATAPVC